MAHKSGRSAMGSTLATLMYCQGSSMITCSLWSVILTSNSLLKAKIDFVNENGSAKHSYSQAGIGKNGENWCVCCLAQRIFDIKTDGAWRAHYPNKISMTTPVLGGWDESCLGRSEGPDLLTKGRWNPQNHSSEKIEKKFLRISSLNRSLIFLTNTFSPELCGCPQEISKIKYRFRKKKTWQCIF